MRRFVGASFFFVVVVVATHDRDFLFSQRDAGFVESGQTCSADDAPEAMADEQQYQDEDRSAAKTLWLGDVQVRAIIFSALAKDCLLCLMLAWDFRRNTRLSISPLCGKDPERLLGRQEPLVFTSCSCRRGVGIFRAPV